MRPGPPVDIPPRTPPSNAVLALGGAAFLQLGLLIFFSLRCVLPAPFSDEYGWIERALHPIGLGYLWEPANNQRIVWARLTTLIDVKFFGAATVATFVTPLICIVAAAFLLGLAFLRAAPNRLVGLVGATVVFAWMTEASLASAIAWPVNSVYVYVAAFASISIAAFEIAPASPRKAWILTVAFVAGVLAGFGNAAGFAVWPVLLFSAVRWRRADAGTVLTLAAGFGFCAVSLAGLGAPTGDPNATPSHGLAHWLKSALYFLDYLGLPLTGNRAPHAINFVYGAAVGLVCAYALLKGAMRGERSTEGMRLGQALILFSLATAALAAIGRVDELPVPVVPVRYGILVFPLHAGLVFCFAPTLARLAARSRKLFWAATAAVLLATLGWQAFAGWWASNYSRTIADANQAFIRGDHTPAVMIWIFPDASRAAAVLAEMRAQGLSAKTPVPKRLAHRDISKL